MLVSAIATYQAIAAQHRAGMALFSTRNAMLSGIQNAGSGETSFNALHQQDVRNDLMNTKAQFMYQVATAWKKHSEEKLAKELNYTA